MLLSQPPHNVLKLSKAFWLWTEVIAGLGMRVVMGNQKVQGGQAMQGALQIVIWSFNGIFGPLHLIGAMFGGGWIVMTLKKALETVLEERALNGVTALMMLSMMAAVFVFVGIRRKGNIEVRDGTMTVSVLLWPTLVFDLSKARVTVEPILSGSGTNGGSGGVLGPMLVFRQGFRDFRIGCIDHGLASAIQGDPNLPPRHGWVRTTAAELLELAVRVSVEIPRPADWEYIRGPVI